MPVTKKSSVTMSCHELAYMQPWLYAACCFCNMTAAIASHQEYCWWHDRVPLEQCASRVL